MANFNVFLSRKKGLSHTRNFQVGTVHLHYPPPPAKTNGPNHLKAKNGFEIYLRYKLVGRFFGCTQDVVMGDRGFVNGLT